MGCLRLIVYGARTRVITIFMKLSRRMWLFDYLQISFLWSVNFDEELIFRVYSRFLIFLAFAQLQKALTSVLHFCYCYSIVYNLLTTCFTALNNEPRGQTFWIFFFKCKKFNKWKSHYTSHCKKIDTAKTEGRWPPRVRPKSNRINMIFSFFVWW